ncbi:uncharacterized protein EAF01_007481 [Botrytis porri]|uniref:uncharacterized protein n=1 Tax=Botrytis porri TaxID=87229 RepID=UPI001901202E|nr:uncharacterized protein EAF01_007481 [Botrytis porri]KAF7902183.1 hypothetical protein EAF01_007481 [Botrytis porri]
MSPNSLTPWDADVPRLQRLSVSDGNSHSSSHSMASTRFNPGATPTNQASRSMNHSPSDSTGRNGSTDNPRNRKYVLTLDGGGVRGLSSLLIIQHLMVLCNSFEQSQDQLVKSSFHSLPFQQRQESIADSRKSRSIHFLPVYYFDYIAGPSTGGLSAIMLSRLRMNSDDCIPEYENLGEKIFGQPRKLSMRDFNYSEELDPGLPLHIPIWQVARASTAAPTYLKPFQLLNERFVDRGYGHNNPTSRTFAAVEQVHGKGTVALTLSIGTARPAKVQPIARHNSGLISRYRQMIKYTAATTTDSEHTYEYVKTLTADQCTYERFNVEGGLGDIDLGEWRVHGNGNITLKKIREQTHVYLNQSEVRRRMEKVARMLISLPQCCNEETIFTREEDIKTHLCETYGFSSAPRESAEELRLKKAIRDGRILHAD